MYKVDIDTWNGREFSVGVQSFNELLRLEKVIEFNGFTRMLSVTNCEAVRHVRPRFIYRTEIFEAGEGLSMELLHDNNDVLDLLFKPMSRLRIGETDDI